METPAALSLIVPLPRPARGSAARLRVGNAELVLEHARGSYSLLWSDGRQARRYVLGLAEDGQLSLELRAPRLPVQVVPLEVLTIVPGARVRGYVVVPLVPTLIWRNHAEQVHTLIELQPRGLEATWHEAVGHGFRCASSWFARFPFQSGEPRVIVPLRLGNSGSGPICPGDIRLRIADEELVPLRGSILTRPQRLTAHEDSFVGVREERRHLSMEEA